MLPIIINLNDRRIVMEIQRVFLFVILLLVSSAITLNIENTSNNIKIEKIESDVSDLEDRDSENVKITSNGEQIPPKRETGIWKPGIDENIIGCSRYCIQRRTTLDAGSDSIKRVNIIWKIINDSRVTFTGEPSWGSQDKELRWEPSKITLDNLSSFTNNPATCELYLQLGCEVSSKLNNGSNALDEYLNRNLTNLVSTGHAEGYTLTEFDVDKETEELRIYAVGKLSQAILEIPIAPQEIYTDARRPRPTLSLSRTSDAKGVRLDARNPPPGGWRLKLLGVENLNYTFSVVAVSRTKIAQDNNNAKLEPRESKEGIQEAEMEKINLGKNHSTPQRLDYRNSNDEKKRSRAIKFDDEQSEMQSKDYSANIAELMNSAASKDFTSKIEAPSEFNNTEFLPKFTRQTNPETETMETEKKDKIMAGKSSDTEARDETIRAKILEDSELEELSRGVENGQTKFRKTVIDVHPNTALVAQPGTFHDVVFIVKNNQPLGIRHAFQGRSTHFQVLTVIPSVLWISPGQEVNVAVTIAVPNVQDATPNTVTLYVGGSENFEVAEKSAYIYVQGSDVTKTDNDKPSIDYSFNDNCAGKLSRDRCMKSRWSVDITVKDSDSGLKRVTSLPEGIEPSTQFVAGTKNSVNFYYISSCCYTTVEITATDVQGNIVKRTIDVTEWDNLSQGEIAAVVLGALLILLLIVFIILIIIYCCRKRKSHDLSYSQRYGSRTPASAERTNF